MIVHATLVARLLGGRWEGVLLRGPSGAGKSDLALRLLAAGWRLVADDRVQLWRSGGALYGRAPDTLAGLLEVRGQGVLAEPALPFARVALAADASAAPERLPDPQTAEFLGVRLPRLDLALLEPSASTRLERALGAAVAGRTPR